jgi:hypothetical protein
MPLRKLSFLFSLIYFYHNLLFEQQKTPGFLILGSLECCCVFVLHYGPPGPLANLWCAI